MNTSQTEPTQAQDQPIQPATIVTSSNQVSQEAVNLASTVETINQLANKVPAPNPDPQQARVDETTILDNSGGRIELNDQKTNSNDFEKVIKE